MKLCSKALAIVAILSTTFPFTSCAGPSSFSYKNVSITFAATVSNGVSGGFGLPFIPVNPAFPPPPQPGSVYEMPNAGQGGVLNLIANVTNASANNVQWQIYPQPNLGGVDTLPTGTSEPVGESSSSVGTFNTPAGSYLTAVGPSVYYQEGGVNVYSGQALIQAQAMGIPQGDVMIVASLQADPDNPSSVVSAGQLIEIYNGNTAQGPPSIYLTPSTPTTPANITNPAVSVAHNPNLLTTGAIASGGSYQFYGGAVGAAPCLTTTSCVINGVSEPLYYTDNSIIWEVGPSPFSLATAFVCTTPGLSCPYGTVSQTGVYTAPAAIPPTPSGGVANEVVVVAVSHSVNTVSKYAYVGLY